VWFGVVFTISEFLIFKSATDPISNKNFLSAEIRQITNFRGLKSDRWLKLDIEIGYLNQLWSAEWALKDNLLMWSWAALISLNKKMSHFCWKTSSFVHPFWGALYYLLQCGIRAEFHFYTVSIEHVKCQKLN